jgi:hypothetical protein
MGALNIVPEELDLGTSTGTPNYGNMNTPLVPQQEEQSLTPSVTEWARLKQQVENDDVGGKTTSSDYFPNMHDPITQQGFSGVGFSAPTIASGGVMPYAAADEFAMRRAEQEQAEAEELAAMKENMFQIYKKDNLLRTHDWTVTQIDAYSELDRRQEAILNSNEATKNLSPRERAKLKINSPEYRKLQSQLKTATDLDNLYYGQARAIQEDRRNNGQKSQYSESVLNMANEFITSLDNFQFEQTDENYKKLADKTVMFETYMGMNELVKNTSANLANQITVDSNIDYYSMDYDVNRIRTIQNSWIYDDVSIGENGEISHGDYSEKFNEYAGRIFDTSFGGMAFSEKEKEKLFDEFKDELALSVESKFEEKNERFGTPGRAKLITDKAKYEREKDVVVVSTGDFKATTRGAFGEPITYSYRQNIPVQGGKLNLQPAHKGYVSGQGFISLNTQGIRKSYTTTNYNVRRGAEIPDGKGGVIKTDVVAVTFPIDTQWGNKTLDKEIEVLYLLDQLEDQVIADLSQKNIETMEKTEDGTGGIPVQSSTPLTK